MSQPNKRRRELWYEQACAEIRRATEAGEGALALSLHEYVKAEVRHRELQRERSLDAMGACSGCGIPIVGRRMCWRCTPRFDRVRAVSGAWAVTHRCPACGVDIPPRVEGSPGRDRVWCSRKCKRVGGWWKRKQRTLEARAA